MKRRQLLKIFSWIVYFAVFLTFFYFYAGQRKFVEAVLFFGLYVAVTLFGFVLSLSLAALIKKRFLFGRASKAELKREDDILLQATGFSQSVLFVYLALMEQTVLISGFKFLVPIFAILFYLVRAYAKLKNSNTCRFWSMKLFGFVLGISIATLMMPLQPSLEVFFPTDGLETFTFDLTGAVFGGVFFGFYNFVEELFKTRYGVSSGSD